MADDGRLGYERYPCKYEANGDRDEMDHNQTVQLFFIGCRVFAIRVSDSVGMMHSRYQDQGERTLVTITFERFILISLGTVNPKYPFGIWYWNPRKVQPNLPLIIKFDAL